MEKITNILANFLVVFLTMFAMTGTVDYLQQVSELFRQTNTENDCKIIENIGETK